MDESEIIIFEIYCFLDFFLFLFKYAFWNILHSITTHNAYAAFTVSDSGK